MMLDTIIVDTSINDKHDGVDDDVHNDGTGTALHNLVLFRNIASPNGQTMEPSSKLTLNYLLKQVGRIFVSDFEPVDIEIKILILKKPTMFGNTFVVTK